VVARRTRGHVIADHGTDERRAVMVLKVATRDPQRTSIGKRHLANTGRRLDVADGLPCVSG
jgi:hypothetical protein